MMRSISAVALLCVLASHFACSPGQARLSLSFKTHTVKDIPIASPAEALRLLRTFTPAKMSLEKKCYKISETLSKLSSGPAKKFWIQNLVANPKKNSKQSDLGIPTENLALAYSAAIRDYLVGGKLDSSLNDVVECARLLFSKNNIRVRTLLAENTLNNALKQWNAITSQSVNFFIDPEYKHPVIQLDELEPSVKETLLKLFKGDEELLESRFFSAEQVAAKEASVEVVLNETKSLIDNFVDNAMRSKEKWNDENLCRVYSVFVDAARGDITKQKANQLAETIQITIEMSGNSQVPFEPKEASVNNLVEVAQWTLANKPEEALWSDLTNCIQGQVQYESAKNFFNSELLGHELTKLEKADAEVAADEAAESKARKSSVADDDEEEEEEDDDDDDDDDEDDGDDDNNNKNEEQDETEAADEPDDHDDDEDDDEEKATDAEETVANEDKDDGDDNEDDDGENVDGEQEEEDLETKKDGKDDDNDENGTEAPKAAAALE